MKLEGRVALVTGGATRIGQAIALALAARGAHVAITYRTSRLEAQGTVARLRALGVHADAFRADLASATSVAALFKDVARRFKRLDVLVNSASNFDRVPFARVTERDWDRALDTNLKGPFLCAWHASRLMKRAGGKIINIADWAGVTPYRDYLPYCVSKSGVIGLTKALAKELAPAIQVVAIAPGPMLPPKHMSKAAQARVAARVPLQRWGSPKDIANTAVFLCEGTDFMTGSTVFVDGGSLIA